MLGVDDILQIRWHGRGGQGAKTAALMLARAAIHEGRFAQGFPEYGPERMGAPVRGYNRIADRPIRRRGPIEEPHVVVVLDPSLLRDASFLQGLRPDGLVLANSTESASELAEWLPEREGGFRMRVVDATAIARAETGSPIPNTVMLGALVALTGAARTESVWAALEAKLGRHGRKLLDGSRTALERAAKEIA